VAWAEWAAACQAWAEWVWGEWEDENGIKGLDVVKIIMTTSHDTSKHIFSSFRQGCEAYVVKSDVGDGLLDEAAKLGLLKLVKVQKNYAIG